IYHIGKNDMYVQTGKGALSLVEVQLQGKKRMDTGSFLRGCHVEEGSFFTL
ncbi:MAG: methionyl-tRNA formyltransferase, partial [Agathobacter rectalis]